MLGPMPGPMLHPDRIADLRGAARLAVDATIGLADLAEAVHGSVLSMPRWGGRLRTAPVRRRGISGFVYRAVRWTARSIGAGLEVALDRLRPTPAAATGGALPGRPRPAREALISALNGVLGDHLAARANPLAIAMELRAERPGGGRIVLLLHGLCRNDRQWRRKEHDHGAALAADLGLTPVYARYNSGLPIAENGRELATRLQELIERWPEPMTEIVVVAHSMGGLVMRSACHAAESAGLGWREKLTKIVFLGTPHHGAPLERGGNRVHLALDATSYTAAFARLARIRSAGITDLRHGRLLAAENGHETDRFARHGARPTPLPLPRGVDCYAAAATLAKRPGRSVRALAGDGLVPLASALGDHVEPARHLAIPAARRFVGRGMSHLDLLDRREVYERIRAWLAEPRVEP